MKEYLEMVDVEGSFEYYFEKISNIPRGSYNNKAISNYLVAFAKEHNLEYFQDEKLNVIIYKKAFSGYEDVPTVIIQGHMDMVCEKTEKSNHDFEKEGLDIQYDTEYVYAKETTLGADDGIAIAYALALLADDNLEAPALEVVITTDEEVGMDGAFELDESKLKGEFLLNLDSEDEGVFLTSCAGGMDVTTKIPISFCEAKGNILSVEVSGLLGGHSGCEIDKNRSNANILLGRILNELRKKYFRINLMNIFGGNKDNAIPIYAKAELVIDERMNGIEEYLEKIFNILKEELKYNEPNLTLSYNKIESEWNDVVSADCEKNIIRYLMISPNGVIAMSNVVEGLVETSLNLGIMKTTKTDVSFSYAVRSSIESSKYAVLDKLNIAADCCGASCVKEGEYPGWAYEPESKLRNLAVEIYEKVTNKKAKTIAIHAGLECGILKSKLKNVDIISYGPDILDIHTTNEKMNMASAIRCYDYTKELLKNIKTIVS